MAKRQTSSDSGADTERAAETADDSSTLGKGHATPTRKEREAARKRPLVPSDRKLAAKQARASNASARERARVGMAAGDERYLTQRDRGPQRRYIRDYVDARYNVGEMMIPIMLIIIILSFLPVPAFQTMGILVLWAFFVVALIDILFLTNKVRRRLGEKYGVTKVERGVRWYAAMRAMQLRVIRLPKPQVKRRQYPR